ncbi:hypothetical protein M6B38_177045 [Iris pallida]|uniref:Uncharacterized protein n=1 Tax=Iris pallida TaxID=29817 RepID=A0AAX6EPV1_IRIPA|nr:hypothetical protein M6B38_177045 [Iris pallida]
MQIEINRTIRLEIDSLTIDRSNQLKVVTIRITTSSSALLS